MDDAELHERMRALEARVEQLEGLLGRRRAADAPPPAPGPAAAPAASPFAPPPEPRVVAPPPLPDERRAARRHRDVPSAPDYERFLGLAVLGRVGVGAVLLAAAWFGQLGWRHLGPGVRTTLVYAFGFLLVGIGAWLRPRVAARYVAMLWGCGVALTWLGGVLGHLRFAVLSSPAAVVSLLGSAALGQFLARALGLQAMATVALAGAYAAPVLVGVPSPTPTAFFALLLSLHAWAAWTEHRWQWHAARALAVGATSTLVCLWYDEHGPVSVWSLTLHAVAVWLGLCAPELLAGARRLPVSAVRAFGCGFGLSAVLWPIAFVWASGQTMPEAALLLAGAALLGGAWLRPRAADLGSWIARAGSLVIALAFLMWTWQWSPAWEREALASVRLSGLLGLGAGLLATRRWTGVGECGAAVAAVVGHVAIAATRLDAPGDLWPFVALVVAAHVVVLAFARGTPARGFGLVGGAAAAWGWLAGEGGFAGAQGAWVAAALAVAGGVATFGTFVATRRRDPLLAWFAAGLHAAVLVVWFQRALVPAVGGAGGAAGESLLPVWNARTGALAAIVLAGVVGRSRLAVTDVAPRAVLAATALAGTYVAGLLELLDAVAAWPFGPRAVASSLYTLAFASLLLVVGFRLRLAALRWTALVAFAAVVVKIAAHDLRDLETSLRVLATGVLGGVLLVAAWAYAKRVQS